MPSVRLEVLTGGQQGHVLESDADVIRVGRDNDNDLVLPDQHVSAHHAKLVLSADRAWLDDLQSTNGTALVRDGVRSLLGDTYPSKRALTDGDVIELGGTGEESTRVLVRLFDDPEPENVISVRPLSQLSVQTGSNERNLELLRSLGEVQRKVGAASDVDQAVTAVADAALLIVPRATHATVVLREEREADTEASGDGASEGAFIPIMTRVRGASGSGRSPQNPVPLTRSVVRKVLSERAAVLATDAPSEAFSSESLLGANIKSTIGVPLFKGAEIIGVLQIDNRDAPTLFDETDLDALGILATNASLAVANARLIGKLQAAEQQLQKENRYLKGRERARSGSVEIIGDSQAMQTLMQQLLKVVDTRVTVLIEGETGTGKELVASAVHYRSRRRDKLLVAQNCAALPENLLESELFGHRRGAFTGATEEKRGLFDVADRGTLFLDEVTEMPLALQAKLLRVLQEGEIRPLGATHTKHVDVRVVAACNRNLEREVAEGRFREDLYYRLKVFPLRVPPLRERRDDVPLLAGHFLTKYTREYGKAVLGFSQNAMELMMSYDWPGNVRELENEVQRLVIQSDPDTFISSELLSPRLRKLDNLLAKVNPTKGTLKEMMDQVERHLVAEALKEHDQNKTNAAKMLGITREGLHKKLRQLKLS